ncbi:hypothetical protein MXD58_020105, partial [Frankia sp. AgKG'84/4]|nr:hypothetical protein [Frankia sp. AgKG'84/4]
MIEGSTPEGGRERAASPPPGEGSACAAGLPGGPLAGGTASGGPHWRTASAWGRAGGSGRGLREAFDRRSDGVRPAAQA